MTEIKSTLDIVMEKTKHLVQTEEEKAQAKSKELAGRAKGLVLGLTEKRVDPEEMENIIRDAGQDGAELKKLLLKDLVDLITLEGDYEDLREILNSLLGPDKKEILKEAGDIISEFMELKNQLYGSADQKVLEELAAVGITGSALKPKTEMDGNSEQEINRIHTVHEARLDSIRERLIRDI